MLISGLTMSIFFIHVSNYILYANWWHNHEPVHLVFLFHFSCRYKLHQYACIRALWSHICLFCSILSWHSSHITVPYFWHEFQWQIVHLLSWSSGQSLVIIITESIWFCIFFSIQSLPLFYFTCQLLLSSWKRSLIPGIFGLVAGSLYRLNVLGIRKMKVTKHLFSSLYFSTVDIVPWFAFIFPLQYYSLIVRASAS